MKVPSPHSPLHRSLGIGFAIVVVLGNIIGSGIFKKIVPMVTELNSSGWVLICWVLGGLVTLFGAISNAEIAGMLADTGGEYSYYKKIYNRFFSYIYGWSNFAAIKTASIASIAYVFAQSLNSVVPFPPVFSSLATANLFGVFYPFQHFNIKLVCILLILGLTWYNSRGLRLGAKLSTILLLLVVTGMLILIFAGNSSSQAEIPRAFELSTGDSSPITISLIFTAMLSAFWAFEGWNSVGFLGGEIKNAHRNLPIAIIGGLLIIIVLYFLTNMTYLSLMSVDQLKALDAAGNQVAGIEAIRIFWGNKGAVFMSIIICLSTLGCTHATIYSHARISYAMAREGLFFQKMSRVNKWKVPGTALWYQGIWACMLVLSGTFDQLTDMLIFAAFIFYGATTLGVFLLRRKLPDHHRPYRVWGYPVVPALFILFCLFLIGNTIYTRPREAILGLCLIFLGIPMYLRFKKKHNLD